MVDHTEVIIFILFVLSIFSYCSLVQASREDDELEKWFEQEMKKKD